RALHRRQAAVRGERGDRLHLAGARRPARPLARGPRDPPGPDRRARGPGGLGDLARAPAAPRARALPRSLAQAMSAPLSREITLVPAHSPLLFIDVQNFGARRDGGEFRDLGEAEIEARDGYYFARLETVALPNMQRLQAACRAAGVEVMYTVIESLTRDGRDRSLDYKITGFHVPKGSWDAKVLEEIAPGDDEIVLPKTS